jgi:hypothetical protein
MYEPWQATSAPQIPRLGRADNPDTRANAFYQEARAVPAGITLLKPMN